MCRLKTPLLKPPIIFDGELGKVRQWAWVTSHVRSSVIPLCAWYSFELPHVRDFGFHYPGNFSCGIRNPGLWNPNYSSRNPYLTNGWNPEFGFHAVESRIQEVLTCIPLHAAIHCGTVAKIFHESFFVL